MMFGIEYNVLWTLKYLSKQRQTGKGKGKVGSILTFSSHAYVSQEERNQKHLFQFAQVFHTAPCHQFSKRIPSPVYRPSQVMLDPYKKIR